MVSPPGRNELQSSGHPHKTDVHYQYERRTEEQLFNIIQVLVRAQRDEGEGREGGRESAWSHGVYRVQICT